MEPHLIGDEWFSYVFVFVINLQKPVTLTISSRYKLTTLNRS